MRAVVDGAAALAGVVGDFISDAELRAAVARDFAASGGPVDVEKLMSPPRSPRRWC